jgi:hypothetical protein
MRDFDGLRALLSAIVLIVLAWAGCELWDWIAAESGGDFPNGLLCVLTICAAVLAWIYFNFGNVLRRG